MPIRLTCPSCSATLSVKDEYAGRAVKCPKCGGVIPASPSAAALPPPPPPLEPEPEPAPAPEPAPLDDFDEPAKPAKPGGKIVGAPTSSRARGADDDRPRPAERDEGDDGPRGKRGPRGARDGDLDDGDRPAKRRRRDEDDRPARGDEPAGKSKTPVILAVVGFLLLGCCGTVGFGVYWVVNKAKETAEKIKGELENWNPSVSADTYNRLKLGQTTREEADAMLSGRGKLATAEDVKKAFPTDAKRAAAWTAKAEQKRVMIWYSGEDHLIAMFHPNADGGARLQAKEYRPKNGADLQAGETDDAKFAQMYPPGQGGDDLNGPALDVTAEDICTAYKDDSGAADGKYKDKIVVVEGKLEALDPQPDGSLYARLLGVGKAGAGGLQVRCVVPAADVNKVYNCSRGQTVKLRGRCAGKVAIFVDVMSCRFESSGADPSVNVTAGALIAAYAANEATADEKYKEKALTLTSATVESKTGDAVFLVASKGAKAGLKIKVAYAGDFKKQFENLKPGDRVNGKVKGEGAGMFNGTIYLNGAWLAP